MAVFPNRKFVGAADANKFGVRYRALMAKHPFLLFGLPFMAVIIGGSFVLTPATAIRYERHDRKVRQMTRDEELGVGKAGRKVDIREEYYVSDRLHLALLWGLQYTDVPLLQRLSSKDIDDWEQKRVKRLPGESDGVL
jgi:cytochrome c oxidase assembly protein subunit 16